MGARRSTGLLAASFALLWTSSPLAAVTVARFRGDRAGAMSFTFDDGSRTQFDPGVTYLDEFGLKGSFYVVAGFTRDTQDDPLDPRIPSSETWARVSWDQWAVVLAGGHEIGNHSMTHPRLPTLLPGDLLTEVVGAKQLIEEKLGVLPLTFVCPFNDGVDDPSVSSLILDHHIALRTTQHAYGGTGRSTLADLNWVADDAVANEKWNVAMIHGLGEPWAPLDPAVYHDHLAYARGLVDAGTLWVGTFADVSRYLQESADVAVDVLSGSASRVEFTAAPGPAGLDPAVFDYPLTFIIETTPDTAALATAIREGSVADMPLVIESGRILIDAPPAAGAVTLGWTTDAGNTPPVVTAGADCSLVAGGTVDLAASVEDVTLPGELVSWWELVAGPATVAFDPTDAETTSATFGPAGEYVVRLCADDGELLAWDAVTVTVSRRGSGSDGGCAPGRGTGICAALVFLALGLVVRLLPLMAERAPSARQ